MKNTKKKEKIEINDSTLLESSEMKLSSLDQEIIFSQQVANNNEQKSSVNLQNEAVTSELKPLSQDISPESEAPINTTIVNASQTNEISPSYVPGDTGYATQWQFTQSKIGNIQKIWDEYNGAGVHVGIYDDGLKRTHSDLNDNYDASKQVIVNDTVIDPLVATTVIGTNGLPTNTHGTHVAGVIAAENNGQGTVGVAFGASITGVTILSGSANINATDKTGFLQAIDQSENFDVINHSWGKRPLFYQASIAGDNNLLLEWKEALNNGRNGLGTLEVKAAGNNNHNSNGDGVNTSRATIVVAAYDQTGYTTYYSSNGANLLVSAPTNLATTSFNASAEVEKSSFNGTSAATPVVTGAIALMLDANNQLGWRDVQNILAYSAHAVGSGVPGVGASIYEDYSWFYNGANNWNGGGLHFSQDYGYGSVNAYNAVRMSEVWNLFNTSQTTANEAAATYTVNTVALTDLQTKEISFNVTSSFNSEFINLGLNLNHGRLSDLNMWLTSPTGTVVSLVDFLHEKNSPTHEYDPSIETNWSVGSTYEVSVTNWKTTFGVNAFRGENTLGTWKLTINDIAVGNSGVINSAALNLFGGAYIGTTQISDTYHYTDEILSLLSTQAYRQVVTDANGGADWLDMAAMTGNLNVSLLAGQNSSSNGITFLSIENGTDLENVVTGDGADTLTGNALNNQLYGMRGQDTLNGYEGNDTLDGGTGIDTLIGGLGDDNYTMDVLGDIVTEDVGAGTDSVTLILNNASTTVATEITVVSNVENFTVTGAGLYNITGNALDNTITGNASANKLKGGDGNDTLNGLAGADTMEGGLGDDSYIMDELGDIVTEDVGAGTDSVTLTLNNASATVATEVTVNNNVENFTITGTGLYNITGNALDNTITGNASANKLKGGDGNDTLNGGTGADSMEGGLGDDSYTMDVLTDSITEDVGAGTDAVNVAVATAGGTYMLGTNLENATIISAVAYNMTGNALDNVLIGNASVNVINGGVGADTMQGKAGNDIYTVDNIGDVIIESIAEGADLVNVNIATVDGTYIVQDNVENATLINSVNYNLTGNVLANTLKGNASNNFLDGGAGIDILEGGAGNDTYWVDLTASNTLQDTVTELASGGNDTIVLRGGAVAAVSTLSLATTALLQVEQLDASQTGATLLDLTGNTLANTLTGNAANNFINGGTGIDTMKGGLGNDTYVIDVLTDVIVENVGEGNDTVNVAIGTAGGTYNLGTAVQNIEHATLVNTVAYNLTGNDVNNILIGNAAANILDGGLDYDQMIGGLGNDIYVVDNEGDAVYEDSEVVTEIDLVQSSVSYNLYNGGYVENLTLTGTEDLEGIGNDLANKIKGNAGNNLLWGGAGVDTLEGGTGDDTYWVELTANNTLEDTVTELAAGGNDTLVLIGGEELATTATITLAATEIENLDAGSTWTDLNLTGNAYNNVITGNAYNNVINGGTGGDVMIGGGGDDTYQVDNIGDVVEASWGVDLVKIAIATAGGSYELGNEVENATLTSTVTYSLKGNELDNVLTGNAAINTLTGGDGDDTLNGLGGADTMKGELGNDTYVIDGTDVIIENVDEGNDTVNIAFGTAGGTYNLATAVQNIENATLVNTVAYNLTGNDVNNVLIGNAAANILNGGLGADTMIGGLGNDIYVVDNDGDVVIEDSELITEIDLVQSSINYYLDGGYVENLTLTGTENLDGMGNELANKITGNAGNNELIGFSGIDTLIGGAGDDTYWVDLTVSNKLEDTVTELATGGNDTLMLQGGEELATTATITLAATEIENLDVTYVFTALNLTGNAYNNVITGNAYNNVINGGTGVDTMIGGGGDDTFVIDNINDVIDTGGTGNHTVRIAIATAGNTYTLDDTITNGELINTVAYNLTGNLWDNVLTGNGLINTLRGGDGNDTLNGLGGADTMKGELGNDTYVIDGTDVIVENAGEGNDTVNIAFGTAGGTYSLATAVQNIENATLVNIVAYNLTGNDVDNILTGNAAANILDGRGGADTMVGGKGNDTYIVDIWDDIVYEDSEIVTEIDLVQSSISYDLSYGGYVENLTLTGTENLDGFGNELANKIKGNTGFNLLYGGAGADTLEGGAGDDTYLVELTANNTLQDTVTELAAGGNDTLTLIGGEELATTATITLAATEIENLDVGDVSTALNLTGNAYNNFINGNVYNNVINGGTGADTMMGGGGDDTYLVDNIGDVVEASWGVDLVKVGIATAGGNYELGSEVENATLTSTVTYSLKGNELDNVLTGNAAINTLTGGDGDDTLNGLGGADTMKGELGNDTYVIDGLTDEIVENADEGNDTVNIAFGTVGGTYSLATAVPNIENATLVNTVAYNLTGNDVDNILTGNAAANILTGGGGNDTLNGLGGADTMKGESGDDTYTIDVLTDVIIENVDEGTDTVNIAIGTEGGTYTLSGTNLENATLASTVAYNLTGNTLNNYLLGNTANNTLTDTAGGNDILQGLAGIDTFNDSTGNNLFDGGLGNDIITAGAGNELLVGGQGNDTITTGTGYDIIVFNKGDGLDTINASTGADNTISLGGNFAYSALSFTKTANNLLLKMGTTDQITFSNWYASGSTNKSVVNLQVIAEAIQGFSLGSADDLRNNKIENFNFADIVSQFDAEGATANWQFTDARLTAHLQAGSDTAAIGGDLAYQYGINSNLTGMGLSNAQSVIAAANFGQTAQTLNNPSVWQAEVVKLA